MMASSPEPASVMDQPLSSLSQEAFTTISLSLSVTQGGLGGRNWEGVAGKMGFNAAQVKLLKDNRESNKGWLLLDTWERLEKKEATLKRLIIALESLRMRGCIQSLQKVVCITDEEVKSAQNECDQLNKSGKFGNYFQTYSDLQFHLALYPHLQRREPSPIPPLPQQTPPQAPPIVHDEPVFSESWGANENCEDSSSESERSRLVPKSVFISYCPESGDAGQRLCNQLTELTIALREYGYTVYFDKYSEKEIHMSGGINMWKEAHIKKSENILVICTPEYYQDDNGALMEGKRSKIGVDRRLLRDIQYGTDNDRLIPILLDKYKNTRNCIPSFVQASPLHFWPSKKEDLLYCLARMAKYQLPEIMEKREIKSIVIPIPKLTRQRQVVMCSQKTHTQSRDSKSHTTSHDRKSHTTSHDRKSHTMSHDRKTKSHDRKVHTMSHDRKSHGQSHDLKDTRSLSMTRTIIDTSKTPQKKKFFSISLPKLKKGHKSQN